MGLIYLQPWQERRDKIIKKSTMYEEEMIMSCIKKHIVQKLEALAKCEMTQFELQIKK